jgi:integrase/recombinase XerD
VSRSRRQRVLSLRHPGETEPAESRQSFDQLRRATGLDRDTLRRHARVHDIRHTFVLRTLLRWYREKGDIESQLPLLSTFLGHVEPKHTFWYFEATPELLALAAERLERAWDQPSARKDEQ